MVSGVVVGQGRGCAINADGWGWGAEAAVLYIPPVPWPQIRTCLVHRIRQWLKTFNFVMWR